MHLDVVVDDIGGALARAVEAGAVVGATPLVARAAEAGGCYRVRDGVLESLQVAGGYAPVPRPPGVLLLSDVKRRGKPVLRNGSAAVWDIGDGVLCFEFTSKMNALDPDVLGLLGKALGLAGRPGGGYRAMVIHNEGENFSVGANLGLALFAANVAAWPVIEGMVGAGQEAYKALKYAPFPVVSALLLPPC